MCSYANNANARVSITNLSDIPQQVLIETANNPQPIIIEPKQTWRSMAPFLTLTYQAPDKKPRTIHARDFEKYAIWPDGSFSIQQRVRRSGR